MPVPTGPDEPKERASAWGKLLRRKVVQWTLAYIAIAWGVLQGLQFAVATFNWPPALIRVGAIIALFGVAVTSTLAWFHGDRGHQRAGRLEYAILGGIVLAAILTAQHFSQVSTAPAAATGTQRPVSTDRRRLAVLPFANLGADPANVAFVGGVHDTLITQIAKVPGLSVISRSSVLQFEGQTPTIKAVAVALNVGTVLEGSVQRDGTRLRIQAQLIDAATDAHLWAETFDRTADDLFAVQSEIAQAVAEQLRIRLTGGDSDRLTLRLTSQPRAYEHYVLGRSHLGNRDYDAAIGELTEAVTLDPGFAAAHAQLSMARTWHVFENPVERATSLPLARAEADRALSLDPTLPEGHLARAVYLYRGEPDIESAANEFEMAIAGLPNDAAAHMYFGYLRRWQGRLDEAVALLMRAAELDPRGMASRSAIRALAALGRRDEALQVIAAARSAQPDNADYAMWPGTIALDFDCDLATAEKVYFGVPPDLANATETLQERWWLGLVIGDSAMALRATERLAVLEEPPEDVDWRRGTALIAAGRREEGMALVRRDLPALLRDIAAAGTGEVVTGPAAYASLRYAALGDRANVEKYARQAKAALPAAGATQARWEVHAITAAALAMVGANDEAIENMRVVLDLQGSTKPSGFWCQPDFVKLRRDPRFRELMQAHGANVAIDPHDRSTWPKK